MGSRPLVLCLADPDPKAPAVPHSGSTGFLCRGWGAGAWPSGSCSHPGRTSVRTFHSELGEVRGGGRSARASGLDPLGSCRPGRGDRTKTAGTGSQKHPCPASRPLPSGSLLAQAAAPENTREHCRGSHQDPSPNPMAVCGALCQGHLNAKALAGGRARWEWRACGYCSLQGHRTIPDLMATQRPKDLGREGHFSWGKGGSWESIPTPACLLPLSHLSSSSSCPSSHPPPPPSTSQPLVHPSTTLGTSRGHTSLSSYSRLSQLCDQPRPP